eukprot:SAG31_NODE_24588_length_478_cov_1.055409_1_plen_75_part_00
MDAHLCRSDDVAAAFHDRALAGLDHDRGLNCPVLVESDHAEACKEEQEADDAACSQQPEQSIDTVCRISNLPNL